MSRGFTSKSLREQEPPRRSREHPSWVPTPEASRERVRVRGATVAAKAGACACVPRRRNREITPVCGSIDSRKPNNPALRLTTIVGIYIYNIYTCHMVLDVVTRGRFCPPHVFYFYPLGASLEENRDENSRVAVVAASAPRSGAGCVGLEPCSCMA